MLEQRRSKVVKAAGLIFGVLVISLVYFLFFNTGLNVVSDPNSFNRVIVMNESQHRIREVSVSFLSGDQKNVVQKIPYLDPHQSVAIDLLPSYAVNGSFVIQASAPFHLTKQIVIEAQSAQVDNANVSFTFTFPTLTYTGKETIVLVTACNNESFALDLQAELSSFVPALPLTPAPQAWSIDPDACEDLELPFIATQAGDNLSFKIRVFTPTRVLAEKGVSMDVLSTDVNGGN